MRLDKALSLAGCSRSEAKKWISAGRVTVGGEIVRDPGMNVQIESVEFNGEAIDAEQEIYLMIHKPAGIVTATEDKRFETVCDLLPESYRRRKIGPVGRLDRDVTGLVILTTNGQLAHRLISPKWKAEKVYRAVCEGALNEEHVRAFANGLVLSDFTAKPAQLEIVSSGESSTALVTLTEGKFHQVKRMFSAIGCPLEVLERLKIGCVTLDERLQPGEFRKLTPQETQGLLKLSGMDGQGSSLSEGKNQ